jgi:hypothetical protein
VREGIDVKKIETTVGADNANGAKGRQATETLVLCRSQDRIVKESAMLGRFVDRLEGGLKLAASAESGHWTVTPEPSRHRV